MKENILYTTKNHINRRLLSQLVIFIVVSFIMIGIVLFDIFHGYISFLLALSGIVIGLLIGFIMGRMFAIKWHEDTRKVIIGMDKTGFLVIILYVVIRISGEQLFGKFFYGQTLTAVTFSTLAGIMIGRFLSIMNSVRKILKVQNIL